jgi:ketosteroid isomerase-like protein
MTTTTDQIIELDRRRMAAMVSLDTTELDQLLADDLVYTHSSAKVDSKASLMQAMTGGTNAYTALEPADLTARQVGDVVLVNGTAAMTVSLSGRPTSFRVRFLDVWTERNGAWQMVAWQSTRLR